MQLTMFPCPGFKEDIETRIAAVSAAGFDAVALDFEKELEQTETSWEDQLKLAEKYRLPVEQVHLTGEGMNGIWRVNMTQFDEKAFLIDPEDVTRAELACRKQIGPLMAFLKEYVPGFRNIRLLQSSQSLGIRESRRIVGDYTLTMEDMAAGRRFEDGICTVGSAVDFHGSSKPDGSYDGAYHPCGSKSTEIPYRSLIPQKVENLLVAGRCLSADQMAHSAVRVMPPCFAMGQAAGTAAAMAASAGIPVRQIEPRRLREKLAQDNVYFD